MTTNNAFGTLSTLATSGGPVQYYDLTKLAAALGSDVEKLPVSIKVLLESALRNVDDFIVSEADVKAVADWKAADPGAVEVPFLPARVVLQDFTGVPAVVDLAALRDACKKLGGNATRINPLVPCDLVIDHSVQVDYFGTGEAVGLNLALEFERNRERYEFLKWGQKALNNFSVVPPGTGIVHQVNLEYLSKVVMTKDGVALPDSLVGTDSHTTMVNGAGIVAWGVGGIEAEAVMLGQPIYMLLPRVIGFRLTGRLPEGATATDLVLTVTEMLRKVGVVETFVEFFGDGVKYLSLPDRATIANMAPEYGATMGFFPVDDVTLDYLRLTGRSAHGVDLVERYTKQQGLWLASHEPRCTKIVELDLATVQPCLAGPKRPQDRINLTDMKSQWCVDLYKTFGKTQAAAPSSAPANLAVRAEVNEGGVAVADDPGIDGVEVTYAGRTFKLKHGAVVIAAITSCTNTSNPSVMLAAGLVARKAVAKGLRSKPWVKTSLAPGSRVSTDYFAKAGVDKDLDKLGFNLVGYGCTTCIGNSGPLPDPISKAVNAGNLVVCSVLSGNRNFEGRVNPDVRANYLASPPLCVAYALAGTTDIDFATEPLGTDYDGQPVFLRDIWPTTEEVRKTVAMAVSPEQFRSKYADATTGDASWQAIPVSGGETYGWNNSSTYIQNPPYFEGLTPEPKPIQTIAGARALAVLGDSVTTDHISPAGSIKKDSPAGKYLIAHGVEPKDFNSYGARRGNHEVMMRGTFANTRIKNLLAPGTEGGVTTDLTDNAVKPIYDAAMNYKAKGIPLVILTGKDYGMGSSRDWAAKGTFLLGVKAVIAESFERIHRSNLVGMGVLPLIFSKGDTAKSLGLTGHEIFDIAVDDDVKPLQQIVVTATDPLTGKAIQFGTTCRIDTPVEVVYYRNGGILHTVVRKIART
jgi:aconitate hydratase